MNRSEQRVGLRRGVSCAAFPYPKMAFAVRVDLVQFSVHLLVRLLQLFGAVG